MTHSDKLVFDQARKKANEYMARRGRLPAGWASKGPGFAHRGNLFDSNREGFERLLKTYFSELYVGWNPFKNNGHGTWEVWQRPFTKTPVYHGRLEGEKFYTLETIPNDFEHHVYDLPFLTPMFIEKLREMDTWEQKDFFKEADYTQDKLEEKYDKQEADNIKYAVKHNKSLFRQLKSLAQDGYNPFWFFSDKRQGDGLV